MRVCVCVCVVEATELLLLNSWVRATTDRNTCCSAKNRLTFFALAQQNLSTFDIAREETFGCGACD